ncbi:hypothetical protein ABTE25_19705, partial [Acinetobacter baumannii]
MLKPVITMLIGGFACGAISAALFLGWENTLAFNIKGGLTPAASNSRFAFKDGRVALIAGGAEAKKAVETGTDANSETSRSTASSSSQPEA